MARSFVLDVSTCVRARVFVVYSKKNVMTSPWANLVGNGVTVLSRGGNLISNLRILGRS